MLFPRSFGEHPNPASQQKPLVALWEGERVSRPGVLFTGVGHIGFSVKTPPPFALTFHPPRLGRWVQRATRAHENLSYRRRPSDQFVRVVYCDGLGVSLFFFAVADWLLIYNTSTVHISLTVVVVVVVRSSRIAQKWLPNDSLAISSKEYSIRKSKTNDTLASEESLTGFI